ncbi:MAG: RNA methyltransferase [Chromatiaceae bacterium]|nr:MAG: RNA methyltransferase [Chromatiaceae bacterium]
MHSDLRDQADDPRPGRIRFVLVEPSLSANIGATARAMKTMGLTRLALVQPRQRPDAEAIACASGADDLLATAAIHDDLVGALAGCRLVIGSSARPRSVQWPQVDPRACARLLCDEARQGDVALLLGRERSGLSNEELARCHYLVQIPANPAFSSLNVAAAAQVFAYEVRQALLAPVEPAEAAGGTISEVYESPLATAEEMEGFFTHLAAVLVNIGYADPVQSRRLQRRLRRLFNRARPDRTEINILRGILRAAADHRPQRTPTA